ncbi:HAD family hydrolase [Anaerocolumna jejuensis]|uniref:HAD family hydrolase n=1 Tax=Anaerocolumna jejuensis TaxID=259063 RepID=UPI003F7BD6BB
MYSFDIFDTIITRTTATPTGIFAIMQMHLQKDFKYQDIDEHIRNHFYHLRICAERLARDSYYSAEVNDITLAQIYKALGESGIISETQLERIQALEIQTEYENTIGIDCNIRKVHELIRSGHRVVLISDMYLDKDIIRKILMKADAVFETIPIYVSSEYKKTKNDGRLYEVVAEKENGGSFKNWYHIGDNIDSDVLKAATYGIKSEYYFFEPLQQYEEELLKGNESSVTAQITAGTARNTRLILNKEETARSLIEKKAFKIGSSFGGPMLYPYVQWILNQCKKQNIKKLYFVARDGYILKKIADKLIEWNGLDITSHYFYGSRKAWRMPSLTLSHFEVRNILNNSYINKLHTFEDIAELFEIPVELLQTSLPNFETLKTKVLSSDAVSELLEILCADDNFKQTVCEIQQEKRADVLAYIKQEINVPEQDFAFVELSGTGVTQECLASIFKDITDIPIRTFYLKKDRLGKLDSNISFAYYLSDLPLSYIIEELCRAPHGQTLGYRLEDGRVLPILADDEKDLLEQHGYSRYIEGVLTFSEMYYKVLNINNLNECDSVSIFIKYLEYIIQKPDRETSDYFGDMPFNLTGRDKEETIFAPKLTRKQLEQIFLTRYNEPIENYYKGSSLEYSLLRCSEEEKELMHQYREKNRTANWYSANSSCAGIDVGWGEDHIYADEYDLIAENVVLYAAGKRGQLLHSQLSNRSEYNIIAWIDANYEQYQKQHLNVQNPSVIKQLEFDQVVIGVLDKRIALEITDKLVGLGVPKKKILWVRPRPRV